jgi:hypothetical protein
MAAGQAGQELRLAISGQFGRGQAATAAKFYASYLDRIFRDRVFRIPLFPAESVASNQAEYEESHHFHASAVRRYLSKQYISIRLL